jgi:hypothetical protein
LDTQCHINESLDKLHDESTNAVEGKGSNDGSTIEQPQPEHLNPETSENTEPLSPSRPAAELTGTVYQQSLINNDNPMP